MGGFFADDRTAEDFFSVMCGELLGSGISREVYAARFMPNMVIKFEHSDRMFANIAEWQLWNEVQHTDAAKWLAPCDAISPCGKVLIQRRTKPARSYPKKIPVWLTDEKRANFGMIGRRFVCHDYAANLVASYGTSGRLKNADWWGEVDGES